MSNIRSDPKTSVVTPKPTVTPPFKPTGQPAVQKVATKPVEMTPGPVVVPVMPSTVSLTDASEVNQSLGGNQTAFAARSHQAALMQGKSKSEHLLRDEVVDAMAESSTPVSAANGAHTVAKAVVAIMENPQAARAATAAATHILGQVAAHAKRAAQATTHAAVKVTGKVVGEGTLRGVAGFTTKALGRFVPVLNAGIAAADGAIAYQINNDPKASTVKKVMGWLTAGLSAIGATPIPVVAQIAGFASIPAAAVRTYID